MEPNACMIIESCVTQLEQLISAVAAEQTPQSLKDSSYSSLSHSECKELNGTISFTKTSLSSASSCATTSNDDLLYILCLTAILRNLQALHTIVNQHDTNSKNKIISFNAKRIKLFQLDFSLRQKVDQLLALYLSNKKAGSHLITDPEGKSFWDKHFGAEVKNIL